RSLNHADSRSAWRAPSVVTAPPAYVRRHPGAWRIAPNRSWPWLSAPLLLAPGIAQRDRAIEHRRSRAMVKAIGHEITGALELQALLGGHGGRPRFDDAVVQHRQGMRIDMAGKIAGSGGRVLHCKQAVVQTHRRALAV